MQQILPSKNVLFNGFKLNKFLDSFGRTHDYLRISVLDKCNFKCKYCYPTSNYLPSKNILNLDNYKKLINVFCQYGELRKVRITGGEPLLSKNTIPLIEYINRNTDIKVIGLTTNGYFLKKQATKLKDAGLTNLNVSLDSLIPEKFAQITGSPTNLNRFYQVYDSLIEVVKEKLFKTIKVNCVVMKDFNENEILEFVELTKDLDICVRFIEYMPFLQNGWERSKLVPYFELVQRIKAKYPDFHPISNVSCSNTAKIYVIPGYVGTIGFITTMSENFCGTCNRLRLTAEGKLKHCIFGNETLDLMPFIKHSEEPGDSWEISMVNNIRQFLSTKKWEHTENDKLSNSLPMIRIGG